MPKLFIDPSINLNVVLYWSIVPGDYSEDRLRRVPCASHSNDSFVIVGTAAPSVVAMRSDAHALQFVQQIKIQIPSASATRQRHGFYLYEATEILVYLDVHTSSQSSFFVSIARNVILQFQRLYVPLYQRPCGESVEVMCTYLHFILSHDTYSLSAAAPLQVRRHFSRFDPGL